MLVDLHTDFSGGRSGGLVFRSLEEFSTVYCDTHSQRFLCINKAEVDGFLELSCFISDPVDVGNLITGSSAFSKSSSNIRKFMVHILLKPNLENFVHYFASVWDECSCVVVWTLFGISFLWDWDESCPFPVCDHCWVFQICCHIECNTFTASSFRIWNSSTGIPSPPLALFVVMLPKVHLTSHSKMSGSYAVSGASQAVLVVKNPPTNAGDIRDAGLVLGLERFPGGGPGNPLWYSCLEDAMDRGAWPPTVHRVTKSRARLKQLTSHSRSSSSYRSSNRKSLIVWSTWPTLWRLVITPLKTRRVP